MGYGSYSYEAHAALARSRVTATREKLFAQRACHPLMSPHGVKVRECRDSVEHPRSLGIVMALDVTGSMGEIPEALARHSLPGFVKTLSEMGVADPQVLFMAVGDAYSDAAPLQVGQFESTGELMDQWLTWSYLEGKGGAQGHETYELALYFAARHIEMDCFTLRHERGYLFLTGDEKPYPQLARSIVKSVIGDDLDDDLPLRVVVEEASRAFEPFFLIPDLRRARLCERAWRDVLGDRVIVMEAASDLPDVAAGAVALTEGSAPSLDALVARMRQRGLDGARIGPIARALMPYAATLGRDSAPRPTLG